MAQDSSPPPDISPDEINNIVSKQLNLPPELEAVRQLSERVTVMVRQNLSLRAAGPEGVKALVWSITPEDPAKMDPAKQAEAMLARANITSGDSVAWGKVLEAYRGVMAGGLSKEEAADRKAEAYLAVVDIGKINKDNFMFTEFATRAGIDFGTFSQLRAQGFSALQIMHAASFTKEMGLDLKKGAVVVATLQRDLPNGEEAMRKMRDNEHDIAEARHKLEEDQKRGAAAEVIAIDQRDLDERVRAGQQYYRQTRNSGEAHKRGTGSVVDQYHDLQRQAFGNNLSADKATPAERNADAEIRGASKPGKPSPRTNYHPLNPTKSEQAAQKMVATARANVADTQATNVTDAETKGRKEVKKVQKNEKAGANEDMIASLNEKPPETNAAATSLEPVRPIQSAQNMQTAKPSQPMV